MKIKVPFFLTALLFIACSKENNYQTKASAAFSTETVSYNTNALIPLNDLGKNFYQDYVGGLYPQGFNKPQGQYAKDLLTASQNIQPLDKSGKPSPAGSIVFISLGASTGGKNMTALIEKTRNNPLVNPLLKVMNGNQPAQKAPLIYIADSSSPYWAHIKNVLLLHKSTSLQVQVVYLETDEGLISNKFPDRPNIIKIELENCMRTMKNKFPNMKVLYVLGRPRTFNDIAPWNSEPAPYYFGWGCKWAIEDQINGKQGTEYKGPNAVAPMITWGFYQWADSLPRKTDNFYWRYSETKDGLHANEAGQDTLATRFQQFLLKDPYASLWYAKQ